MGHTPSTSRRTTRRAGTDDRISMIGPKCAEPRPGRHPLRPPCEPSRFHIHNVLFEIQRWHTSNELYRLVDNRVRCRGVQSGNILGQRHASAAHDTNVEWNHDGYYITSQQDLVVDGGTVEGNTGHGFDIYYSCNSIRIANIYFEQNASGNNATHHDIYLHGSGAYVPQRITIDTCYHSGGTGGDSPDTEIMCEAATGVTIINPQSSRTEHRHFLDLTNTTEGNIILGGKVAGAVVGLVPGGTGYKTFYLDHLAFRGQTRVQKRIGYLLVHVRGRAHQLAQSRFGQ